MSDQPDPLRELLRAARPSGQDDADPDVRAARESADADMQAALAAERETDAAIGHALRSVAPPDDLEARLLTAIRAARAQIDPPAALENQVVKAVRATRSPEIPARAAESHWSRRQWFAAAAAAVAALGAGGTYLWRRQGRLPMSRLTTRLTTITREGVTLSLMSMDKNAVAEWFRTNGAARSAHLHPRLDALGRKGCHLYDIEGHPVSLECLVLANMNVVHCFTTPSAELRDPPPSSQPPDVTTQAGFTLATWTQAGQTVVLVSEEAPEVIRSLLA